MRGLYQTIRRYGVLFIERESISNFFLSTLIVTYTKITTLSTSQNNAHKFVIGWIPSQKTSYMRKQAITGIKIRSNPTYNSYIKPIFCFRFSTITAICTIYLLDKRIYIIVIKS